MYRTLDGEETELFYRMRFACFIIHYNRFLHILGVLQPQVWLRLRRRLLPRSSPLLSRFLLLLETDPRTDATVRQAAEQQLSQAAESDFVSVHVPPHPGRLQPQTLPQDRIH